MMTARRLLKSWAIPPARRPTASIFWACRSWASRRLCSVVSSRIASVPISAPAASRRSASEKRHSTQRPSRARISASCSRMRSSCAEPPHQRPGRLEPAALVVGDRPAQDLVGAVAQELLGARAPVGDVAPHVGGDDPRRRVLGDRAEEIARAARVRVEPRVPDRQRGVPDEALEQLPVLGVEVEGHPARSSRGRRAATPGARPARCTRSGGRAPGTSRRRGPARRRRRRARSPPGGASRPSRAGPRRTRCGGGGTWRRACRRRTRAARASAPTRPPPRARRRAPPSAPRPRARSR